MTKPNNESKKPPCLVFDQGYSIDRAYAEADRHLTGSDAWHYWMDEAKRLETLVREP